MVALATASRRSRLITQYHLPGGSGSAGRAVQPTQRRCAGFRRTCITLVGQVEFVTGRVRTSAVRTPPSRRCCSWRTRYRVRTPPSERHYRSGHSCSHLVHRSWTGRTLASQTADRSRSTSVVGTVRPPRVRDARSADRTGYSERATARCWSSVRILVGSMRLRTDDARTRRCWLRCVSGRGGRGRR